MAFTWNAIREKKIFPLFQDFIVSITDVHHNLSSAPSLFCFNLFSFTIFFVDPTYLNASFSLPFYRCWCFRHLLIVFGFLFSVAGFLVCFFGFCLIASFSSRAFQIDPFFYFERGAWFLQNLKSAILSPYEGMYLAKAESSISMTTSLSICGAKNNNDKGRISNHSRIFMHVPLKYKNAI